MTAVQNGEADWMFDQPPADRLGEIGTKYKDQVHVTPLTAWWYAPMNTHLAPFDNVKARQAVNYAIDRKALVNLFGGPVLAAPVCQVLPPGFPGHERLLPVHQGSGREMVGARHGEGQAARGGIRHQGPEGDDHRRGQRGLQVDRRLSAERAERARLRGQVKPISPNIQFTYIQNTNNKVQISITQWYQDYPAASDFLNILFGCGLPPKAPTPRSTSPASATRRSTTR